MPGRRDEALAFRARVWSALLVNGPSPCGEIVLRQEWYGWTARFKPVLLQNPGPYRIIPPPGPRRLPALVQVLSIEIGGADQRVDA